jgi:hypothetical protein
MIGATVNAPTRALRYTSVSEVVLVERTDEQINIGRLCLWEIKPGSVISDIEFYSMVPNKQFIT